MNIYIFDYIEQCSDRYHSGGGVVVIAKDKRQLNKIIEATEDVEITENEIKKVKKYKLAGDYKEEVYVFPDAGCC